MTCSTRTAHTRSTCPCLTGSKPGPSTSPSSCNAVPTVNCTSPASGCQPGRRSSFPPICAKDGFPKLKIDGRWQCVAEYLDRCIGGQRIVDMVEREGTVYYVFESGHELPSLCSCCGRPYEYSNLEASRRNRVGRRLVSMTVEPEQTTDGRLVSRFCLELSRKHLLSKPLVEPIHIEAAAQMKHPADCPHGRAAAARRSPPSDGQRSRERRKRKK